MAYKPSKKRVLAYQKANNDFQTVTGDGTSISERARAAEKRKKAKTSK